MTQSELNQLVAHCTGEEETTIQERGFILDADMSYEEREPLTIDWDDLQASRHIPLNMYRPCGD